MTVGYQQRFQSLSVGATLRGGAGYCRGCLADGVNHPVRLVGRPAPRYGLGDTRYSGLTFGLELPTLRLGYAF